MFASARRVMSEKRLQEFRDDDSADDQSKNGSRYVGTHRVQIHGVGTYKAYVQS